TGASRAGCRAGSGSTARATTCSSRADSAAKASTPPSPSTCFGPAARAAPSWTGRVPSRARRTSCRGAASGRRLGDLGQAEAQQVRQPRRSVLPGVAARLLVVRVGDSDLAQDGPHARVRVVEEVVGAAIEVEGGAGPARPRPLEGEGQLEHVVLGAQA